MQREEDFVALLKRAESLGALQQIQQVAVDLGVKILVKNLVCDIIRTVIGFEIRDNTMGYTVSKATLTDEENGISYCLLSVKSITGGEPFPWFLEFEPVLPQSKLLTLTVLQLQIVEEGKLPLVKINTINDPWEPPLDIDGTLLEKIERWREELQAPSMELPPTWECSGQWRFVFAPDLSLREKLTSSHPCHILIPLLNQVLRISKALSGITGTMLYCDSYHRTLETDDEEWKHRFIEVLRRSKDPMDFALRLKQSGLNILRPMFFKITVQNKLDQYLFPTSGSGPWGIYNTRFYYFCDAFDDIRQLRLRIEEVFNLALEEPWVFELDLKDSEQNKELPFQVSSPFINVSGKLIIDDIRYDTEYILISHHMELFTGNVNYVRMREMKIIDKEGFEYQPLDKSSHWSEKHGMVIKGVSFPPVHYRGSRATLEISSIDIAPLVPFEFSLVYEE
ncbi:MAG: hypothetical protein RDV48_15490 [Candidatus Eremiobacteraeota bacterium]|nr:hypothetical protein [Candidatus Eremiobacteraeota bacterium]